MDQFNQSQLTHSSHKIRNSSSSNLSVNTLYITNISALLVDTGCVSLTTKDSCGTAHTCSAQSVLL